LSKRAFRCLMMVPSKAPRRATATKIIHTYRRMTARSFRDTVAER
jgi:hypothetical protein